MQFITRPLLTWPRPLTRDRRRSPYSLTYDKTLRALDREIRAIGGKGDVILQLDIQEHEISTRGTPYADARPRSPRVAIAFDCKHGPLTYYCDRFFDWQSNVRAIGLGLERLRLVEETGIVSRGEQYTGFKALPPGIPMPAAGRMTLEEAASELAQLARGGPELWYAIASNRAAILESHHKEHGR
jgi:hypothetical protein